MASEASTRSRRTALTVWALALCEFCVAVDVNVVMFIVPAIQRSLGSSFSASSAVIGAYSAFFAGAAVVGGRLTKTSALKPLICLGLVLIAAGCVLSALSGSLALLLVGRVIQAAGSALVFPASLAAVGQVDEQDPSESGAASAIRTSGTVLWSVCGSAGLVAGSAIGGAAASFASWQWAFGSIAVFALLVAATLGVAMTSPSGAPDRVTQPSSRWTGPITLAIALGAIVYGLSNAGAYSGIVLGCGIALLALVAAITWFRARTSSADSPARIDSPAAYWIAVPAVFGIGDSAVPLAFSEQLQSTYDVRPVAAGLCWMATAVCILIGTGLPGRLRLPPPRVTSARCLGVCGAGVAIVGVCSYALQADWGTAQLWVTVSAIGLAAWGLAAGVLWTVMWGGAERARQSSSLDVSGLAASSLQIGIAAGVLICATATQQIGNVAAPAFLVGSIYILASVAARATRKLERTGPG